jgi:hypothetical protein
MSAAATGHCWRDCWPAVSALHLLLRPVLDRLDRLPAPQASALRGIFGLADTPNRFLVELGVLGLLAEVAAERPLLCLVADAQWLDRALAEVLVSVARRLAAEPIVLLVAACDTTLRQFHAPGLPELHVGGLDLEAAGQLLEAQAGNLAPSVRDRLIQEAGGNPLALMELPATLTEQQLAGHQPLPERIPLTSRLQRAFLQRVRRLPAATQTLLLVAAAEDTGELATSSPPAASLPRPGGVGAGRAGQPGPGHRRTAAVPASRWSARPSMTARPSRPGRPPTKPWLGCWPVSGRPTGGPGTWPPAPSARMSRWPKRWSSPATGPGGAAGRPRPRPPWSGPPHSPRTQDGGPGGWSRPLNTCGRRGMPSGPRCWWTRPSRSRPTRPCVAASRHLRGQIQLAAGTPAIACTLLIEGARLLLGSDPKRATELLVQATWAALAANQLLRIVEEIQPAVPRMDDLRVKQIADSLLAAGLVTPAVATPDLPAKAARTWPPPTSIWMWPMLVVAEPAVYELNADEVYARLAAARRAAATVSDLTVALGNLAMAETSLGRWADAISHATDGLQLATETGQQATAGYFLALLAGLAAAQGRAEDCRRLAEDGLAAATRLQLPVVAAFASWTLGTLDLIQGHPAAALERLLAVATPPHPTAHNPIALLATGDLVEAAAHVARWKGWNLMWPGSNDGPPGTSGYGLWWSPGAAAPWSARTTRPSRTTRPP